MDRTVYWRNGQHFYHIPAALETVNDIPGCRTPKEVFPPTPLKFAAFRTRLENHFENTNCSPVMIDDGLFTLNIIGMQQEGLHTILWIADPHIQEGVNQTLTRGQSPVGLYTITLNKTGKQLFCSLNDKDAHQVPYLFSENTHKGLHFDQKRWMVLFPLAVQ